MLAECALSGRSIRMRYQIQREARQKAAEGPSWFAPGGINERIYRQTGRVVRVVVLDLNTGEEVA